MVLMVRGRVGARADTNGPLSGAPALPWAVTAAEWDGTDGASS